MWLLVKVMLAQWAVRRLVWKGVGSLLFLLPLGALLKLVGWPVLLVLGVLALPVLLFLLVIGLPILLVLLLGMLLLGVLGAVLAVGGPLLKLLVVVGIPIALAVWLLRRLFRRSGPPTPPTPPAPPSPPPAPEPPTWTS